MSQSAPQLPPAPTPHFLKWGLWVRPNSNWEARTYAGWVAVTEPAFVRGPPCPVQRHPSGGWPVGCAPTLTDFSPASLKWPGLRRGKKTLTKSTLFQITISSLVQVFTAVFVAVVFAKWCSLGFIQLDAVEQIRGTLEPQKRGRPPGCSILTGRDYLRWTLVTCRADNLESSLCGIGSRGKWLYTWKLNFFFPSHKLDRISYLLSGLLV